MLDLAKAREELLTKGLLDIERATAITWAGRAAACLDLAHEAETRGEKAQRLREAENYRQEAIEHAAMTEDLAFLARIIQEIDAHKLARDQTHAGPGAQRGGARPLRNRPERLMQFAELDVEEGPGVDHVPGAPSGRAGA